MERPAAMPRFPAAALAATTSGRWLALATTAGFSLVAPRAKTESGRSGRLRQVQSMLAPGIRPRHAPDLVGTRERPIPDSRLRRANRIVAMKACRAACRQPGELRQRTDRAGYAAGVRRRLRCDIEQQRCRHHAAAALENVDA